MTIDVCRLFLDESPDAFIVLTPEGSVLHWGRAAESIFGYTAAEAAGQSLTDIIVPPDRIDDEHAMLRELFDKGHAASESIRRRKDGSLVYVSISSKIVRDGEGSIRYLLVSTKDVTQLKVMRDAKLVEARYRDLLESLPDGIVMVNAAGRIVFSNAQAEALFGYAGGALRGKSIETLLPQRFRGLHVSHRSHYFGQLRTRSMGIGLELYGLRVDGSEFPVEISLSPLITEEGTLVMSAIRDITERKRFERALQEKNVELANANAAKDHFPASMSHELRTPLNAIIGFTGTLLMKLPGPLNADQERQLRTVQQSGQHLLALINDLLDVAKIEAGKFDLVREDTDCNALVEEVAGTLRPQAEGRGLSFVVEMPDERITAKTDRRAVKQIVINLVQNAIKFTERGQVRVGLRRSRVPNPQGAEFLVEDTGVGIREEDQARLFTAFSRIAPARGKVAEGTGLGLHLSQPRGGAEVPDQALGQ